MTIQQGYQNPLVSTVAGLLDKIGEPQPISESNPIPTTQLPGSSALPTALTKQCVFVAHGVNVAASLGNLSKFELFNPADSGKILIVYQCPTWHTSGSVTYKVSLSTNSLSTNESAVVKQNIMAGSNIASVAKIYTKNDDNTSATNVISQISITSTSSNGTNVIPLFQGILLPSFGLRIEALTANMAINGVLVWAEIDMTDIPPL